MTSLQTDRIKEFENEVRKWGGSAVMDWKESNSPESCGVLFADADGVTLVVYPSGLISIPAVCSYHPPKYPTPIIAAALAKELWTRQKVRDDAHPEKAQARKGGHLGPIVDPDWKCRNKVCPCHRQSPEDRQKRARGGLNTNPNRCS